MKIDETKRNGFISEEDRVILFDSLANDVVYGNIDYPDDDKATEAFLAEFEWVENPHTHYWLGNPEDRHYQGLDVVAVIRRLSDDRLFGFQFWKSISKYGEAYFEGNGSEHGFDWEIPDGYKWDEDYYPDTYAFLPVEEFHITGYKIARVEA